MAEVEETFKKILGMKGVKTMLVLNHDGIPIKTAADNESTKQLVSVMQPVVIKACSVVKEMDPTNELIFLRLRTKKDEILMAHDAQANYTMIAVQEPTECHGIQLQL